MIEELEDGAVVVELPFAGHWLVREILKEAGDAAVLDPEDARTQCSPRAKRLARAPPAAGVGERPRSGCSRK